MKVLVVACLVAVASADVSHVVGRGEQDAQIVRQELDMGPDGTYQWALETDNGISIAAKGDVKVPTVRTGEEAEAIQTVQGQAAWTSPEGEKIELQYVADENGYQPQGSHLPTPPPIPAAILRALEYIRANAPPPEN